jgi:hypothetical protein
VEQEFLYWRECANVVLAEKTAAMDRPGYQPCDQYWLLLRDELTGERNEVGVRAKELHEDLQKVWRKRSTWFSRIIIQEKSLDWQVQITKEAVIWK